MTKKVLVTGANGGFGKLTVNSLIKNGHTVAASMRDTAGRNASVMAELEALGAAVVEIDVSKEDSVNAGVAAAIEKLGGLDVVVNNAGLGMIGLQEEFTPEQYQKLFDINVFGVQRVIRAALPHLRSQQSGLLIQVSSILGRMNLPFYAPYNASKWAVEALAEGYRLELSAFGIESVIVEPGGFPTGFFDSLMHTADQSRRAEYGPLADGPKQLFDSFEGALSGNPEQNPQLVADSILKLVESPTGKRPGRTVVDTMGMGAAIDPYNQQLEQIHESILGNFGMGDMMHVQAD